jgi:hypothetical protein
MLEMERAMIDLMQTIEWLDTNGEWKEATTLRVTRDFAFVTLSDGWPYVVHPDGKAFYLIEYGKSLKTSVEFRNRPPVPAPAACEHDGKTYGICSKCGKHVASSPTPAPDSVRRARELIGEISCYRELERRSHEDFNRVLECWSAFCAAYISEQTAQRRAAGELAARVNWYIGQRGETNLANMYAALAADAQARAGGAK